MTTPISRQRAANTILRVIPRLKRTIAAQIRREKGAALAQFGLLAMVKQGPRSLGELAERQGVSLPTLSSSVSTLAERGWVTRLPSRTDRRVMIVEITSLGEKVLADMQERMEAFMTELLSGLSQDQLDRLIAGVEILDGVFPSSGEASRIPDIEKEGVLNESH